LRRSLSGAASPQKPEILSIFQTGLTEPEMIEVNKAKRTIRAREHVVKAIHKSLSGTIDGIFTSNDDEGRSVVNWPAQADEAVNEYIKAHSGDKKVLQSTFVYQGAFAVGVKRVKVLSLFSLILTSVGGPLLVVGEQSATIGQWAVAAAVVLFGTSTTGLLHLITSPYVLTLRRIADGSFEAETPLITGGVKNTKFTKEEVMPSSRPFTSFTAKGQGFFVHKELFIGDDAQMMLCDVLGDKVAEEMYEALLKKDPNDLDTLYNYGRFLWKVRRDYDAAEGAFTAILAEDPGDKEVLSAFQAMNTERGKASE
jgi:tetratricopeptide (TPR) repeat protein